MTTDDEGARFEMGATPLPTSLANLLMERFDHLAAGPRAALEAAAVLGRQFPPGLLAEVAEVDDDAKSLLRPLLAADLVMANAEDGGYEFRNALIRDAVYDSLLGSRRAELHGRAGRALERVHANRPEEAADVLAHHYGRGENPEKAMRYLALAGDRSLAVHALDEATERHHAVLDLFERHPGADDDGFLADVLLGLARIYYFTVDFGALIRMVEAHLPRIEALGDPKRLSRFLFEAGYAHVFSGRQDIGKPLLERALAIGEEIGDEAAVAYAKMGLSWHYAYWEPPGAERRATMHRLAEEVAEWGRRNGDIWVASKALVSQGNEGAIWGRPDEARHHDMKLLELGRETGDPLPRAMALWRLAYLHAILGDLAAGIEYADESLALSISLIDRLYAEAARATALVFVGQPAESLAKLEAMRDLSLRGELRMVSFIAVDLPYGLALVTTGRMADGVAFIEAVRANSFQTGQTAARIWADYFLGEIYLKMALSKERSSFGVFWRNLGFLLRTAPRAARLATAKFNDTVEVARAHDLAQLLASSLFGLGRLDAAAKRGREARAKFDEARGIAEQIEAEDLAGKIDAAIRELG